MKRLGALVLLSFWLWAGAASAQINPFVTLHDCSGTLTTAGTQQSLLSATSGRRYVLLHNPTSGNNLGISLSGTAASIGSAGTVTLTPGGTMVFETNAIAQNGFNGVGAVNSQPYTCWSQ